MGIRRMDRRLCVGCGNCVDVCPMDVLRMDEESRRPFIAYLRDCQSCFLCERECPVEGALWVTPGRERRIPLPW
jgi:NAD-dependent dihydropyrimidine dehydrogenase PreA subunit